MMSVKMWLFLFVTLMTLSSIHPEEDSTYCGGQYVKLCQGKGTHVGCQFPNIGPGPTCFNYTPIKFRGTLQETVLDFINKRRQKIAAGKEKLKDGVRIPKSKVMMYVEWDEELAELAQRLADQCTFTHDDCRATSKYPYAGQNVGEVLWKNPKDSDSMSFRNAVKGILNAWYNERKRASVQQLTGPFKISSKGVSWGHFSQLAVWTLRAVGCGAVRYGERNSLRLLLVCDFSHNNMIGQKTINAGPQAACPFKTGRRIIRQYPLLCAPIPTKANQEEDEDDDGPKEVPASRDKEHLANLKSDDDYRDRSAWMDDFWKRLTTGQLVAMNNVSALTEKMFSKINQLRERDAHEDHEESPKSKEKEKEDKDEDDNSFSGRESRKKESRRRKTEKSEDDDGTFTRNSKGRHGDKERVSEHMDSDSDGNSDEEDYIQNKSEEHGNRDGNRDSNREGNRDSNREPTIDSNREGDGDGIRGSNRDSMRETNRDVVRESNRESNRDGKRENSRDGNRDGSRDSNRDSKRENNREEHAERRDEETHVVHKPSEDEKPIEEERKTHVPVESKKRLSNLESRRRKFKEDEETTKKTEKPRYLMKFRSNNAERESSPREKTRTIADEDEDDHPQPQHRKEGTDRLRKDRPERPGALALQTTEMSAGKTVDAKLPRLKFSGNMDTDDMDQLFKDTGFHIPKKA